jgi:DNA-nicking Smr family endonuclease
MASSNDTFSNRPFEKLGRLLRGKTSPHIPASDISTPKQDSSASVEKESKSEQQLFLDAVQDVTPLQKNDRSFPSSRSGKRMGPSVDSETNGTYQKLKRLVTSGEGFIISQTPEYMEGTGHQIPRVIVEHLHQGRFSIQDHIDLHGMDASGASEALERFLRRSTSNGLRSVLVIHGRGLSSPGEPVLKSKLRDLLLSNRWRKWILAFSSARSCDGGTGATYVLFRKMPLSKKKMKNPLNF